MYIDFSELTVYVVASGLLTYTLFWMPYVIVTSAAQKLSSLRKGS